MRQTTRYTLHGVIWATFLLVAAVLQACAPCAGKTGDELAQCEAEQAADRQDANVVFHGEVAATGDWLSDDSQGVKEGSTAIHPPALDAHGEASTTFDCGGHVHTQLSFWLDQAVGGSDSNGNGVPLEQLGLDLLVDGMPRGSFGGLFKLWTGRWSQFVIDVPQGAHVYTFTAHSSAAVATPFVLDSFECRNLDPTPGETSFDSGFIPPETQGAWFTDNTQGLHDGEAAIHPLALDVDGSSSMSFNCNGEEHTKLTFWLAQLVGGSDSNGNGVPLEQLGLDLAVDGNSRASFGGLYRLWNGRWQQFVFDVPQGAHEYTFTAHSAKAVAVPFVIDSFDCQNHDPKPSADGAVAFDDGFIPEETVGAWFVDNTEGLHDGEAAIHPPVLDAGVPASMTFDCGGRSHSQLTFWLAQLYGGSNSNSNGLPLEQLGLDLSIDDGASHESYGGPYTLWDGKWQQFMVDVSEGAHSYKFSAHSDSAVPVPFIIDDLSCGAPAP